MPSSAIATGKVDFVLPVAEIPERLVELWSNARRIEIPDAEKVSPTVKPPSVPAAAEEALRDIMKTLHQRTGHDFKQLQARHRAAPHRAPPAGQRPAGPVAYRALPARARVDEPKALLEDLLIGVTKFFRDATRSRRSSATCCRSCSRPRPRPSRCAPGSPAAPPARRRIRSRCCCADEPRRSRPARDDQGVRHRHRRARDRRRPRRLLPGGDRRRRAAGAPARFFTTRAAAATASARRCASSVIFAPHNVLRDPPFSRLDLVSCRNLLIYLDRDAQQQVLEMFHFALRPGGYLFLGTSETADAAPQLLHAGRQEAPASTAPIRSAGRCARCPRF